MESALANHLSMKLSNSSLPSGTLFDLFIGLLTEDQDIMRDVKDDLIAVKESDPACTGILIGTSTCVLGNVRIEDEAKIGSGSVVLKHVPARTIDVGNPARLIGGKENPIKLDKMPSLTMDHTSHISD
ncbi:Serine acetyltransferase 1 [Forsythia ovata]|uniref:Serine acetyltransferase 1 n=1 Tax=Forsythia ovata TaxID=205694 RepID=A0ABD1S0T9_9LAMI